MEHIFGSSSRGSNRARGRDLPANRIGKTYDGLVDGRVWERGGRNGPSSEISLTPGAAPNTSGMRLTIQAAEVCTPSARSTRTFEAGRPSTVHIMCSVSPGKRMRNSICAVAVGPSCVSTVATILRPSEVPGSKDLFRIPHHTGGSESTDSLRSVTLVIV